MKKSISLFAISLLTIVLMAVTGETALAKAADSVKVLWTKEFTRNILGGTLTWVSYFSAMVFTIIGSFIRWYWKTYDAVKNNPNTPNKFSFSYWLKDNALPKLAGLVTNLMVVFVCLRFSVELFNIPFSMLLALGVGLLFDWFFDFLKNLQPNLLKNITLSGTDHSDKA